MKVDSLKNIIISLVVTASIITIAVVLVNTYLSGHSSSIY